MAAAHVSALVARIVEAYPRSDGNAVRETLIRECTRRVDVEDDALNLDPTREKSPADDRPKQYATSNRRERQS
jgi:hypothetical protein